MWGRFDNDPGFTFRVKARSGASACPFSRCLAGKCRFQAERMDGKLVENHSGEFHRKTAEQAGSRSVSEELWYPIGTG